MAASTTSTAPAPVVAKVDPNSIVDYLGSTGKASDFNSRAALAKANGIVDYVGSAEQNTNLLNILRTPKSADAVTDTKGAAAFINSDQPSDFKTASTETDPKTKTSTSSYDDLYQKVTDQLTANLPQKPTVTNFGDQYKNLRGTYGIDELEGNLNDLQAQARDLRAASAARTAAEKNKAVPMNVIEGRVSEEEAQDNARLNAINNSIQTTSAQLATKYSVVDNIMKYSQTDYSNAVDAYNTQFTQNISMMNTVRGVVNDTKSEEETQKDNARANLQIIYNNLGSSGASVASLDPKQKADISKLELQAGLPQGFYASVVQKNPKSDILSTTTRTTGGKKYADVILKNADGSLATKSIALGDADDTSGSIADKEASARALVSPQLTARKGSNGYVSAEDFIKARDAWVGTPDGLSAESFNKAYQYLANPEDYTKLGLKF